MSKHGSLDALKEWTKPAAARAEHVALAMVFAALMLLAGRLWGESLIKVTEDRALQNEAALQGLELRFEDHVIVEARQHTEILEQLREIRGMLQADGREP